MLVYIKTQYMAYGSICMDSNFCAPELKFCMFVHVIRFCARQKEVKGYLYVKNGYVWNWLGRFQVSGFVFTSLRGRKGKGKGLYNRYKGILFVTCQAWKCPELCRIDDMSVPVMPSAGAEMNLLTLSRGCCTHTGWIYSKKGEKTPDSIIRLKLKKQNLPCGIWGNKETEH